MTRLCPTAVRREWAQRIKNAAVVLLAGYALGAAVALVLAVRS